MRIRMSDRVRDNLCNTWYSNLALLLQPTATLLSMSVRKIIFNPKHTTKMMYLQALELSWRENSNHLSSVQNLWSATTAQMSPYPKHRSQRFHRGSTHFAGVERPHQLNT